MKKKILFVSNYYVPYVSGVTEVERLLAEKLSAGGYEVKVITARHDRSLAKQEVIHGVAVERCSIQAKISKGTVSIPFVWKVIREAKKYDIVNMQLPMLESGLLSLFIDKHKMMPMYHCDMNLPDGICNRLIMNIMDFSHRICLRRSSKIWVTSKDYALHSRVAQPYSHKFVEVGGTVKPIRPGKYSKKKYYTVGFCGRIVAEKGIDVLIQAFEILQKQNMHVQLLIGGDYKNIAGGSVYPLLRDYVKKHNLKNIRFLGKLPDEKLGEFYSSLDVFVLPSINELEAFGLVQIEAMLCGTPVVATDLYGVRTIVKKTGMGLISQAGNPDDLAKCIKTVLENRELYVKNPSVIHNIFSTEAFVNSIYKYINTDD